MLSYSPKHRSINGHLTAGLFIVLSALICSTETAIAQVAPEAFSISARASVSYVDLEKALERRITSVPEFSFIREEAEKLGVRAYLFGGTAASYAHYVMNDLLREQGDTRYQSGRFDYDYTSIYYSSQDLDVVIDGTPDQAREFEAALVQKFPYLKGSRGAWDVRLLRSTVGDREALLNNPDFLNQHTDSDSTGLIEITVPQQGDSPVRDLRDWGSKEPNFLKDVRDGTIHYYYSETHSRTGRAARGDNPPIISAIRYLTKVFQYDLKMRPEDKLHVEQVINKFDPEAPISNYVKHWIEKNGKKLFFNAANIEYAWDVLNEFGLRQKLIDIGGSISDPNTLAYWMNKEPLRSFQVGAGDGRTAQELGIEIVAHETKSLWAYESITKSPIGGANVFVSRGDGHANEYAMHGAGFYTVAGRYGASSVGSGYSVRFQLNPSAREHSDFDIIPWNDGRIILVKNKNALTVIHETMNVSFLQFFEMLESGYYARGQGDMALVDRLRRRLSRSGAISREETDTVANLIRKQLNFNRILGQSSSVPTIIRDWFSWPAISAEYPDIVERLIERGDEDSYLITNVLAQPEWSKYPNLVEQILSKSRSKSDQAEIDGLVASHILTQPQWVPHATEWINAILKRGDADGSIAYALSEPQWQNHAKVDKWLNEIVLRGNSDQSIIRSILNQPRWVDRSDWLLILLKRDKLKADLVSEVLSKPPWRPELVRQLIDEWPDRALTFSIPGKFWLKYPALVERLIDKNTMNGDVARYILSASGWENHDYLVDRLINAHPTPSTQRDIVEDLLAAPEWANHPKAPGWIEEMIRMNKGADRLEAEVTRLTNELLAQPPWLNNESLRAACNGKNPTVECLKKAFQNGVTFSRKEKTCSRILVERVP